MDEYEDIDTSLHAQYIKETEDGHVAAARVLMREAACFIEGGVPVPQPLAGYLATALHNSCKKPEDIAANFNVKNPYDKNKYSGNFKKALICLEVRYAAFSTLIYNENKVAGTNEREGKGAYQLVANKYNYTYDYVRGIFEKRKDCFDDELKDMEQSKIEVLLDTFRGVDKYK